MATEYPIATRDQHGVINLPPETLAAHQYLAQMYGEKYEDRVRTMGMNGLQRATYRTGKVLGSLIGAFVYLPPKDSAVVMYRRSINPYNLGAETYETRSYMSPEPVPGRLVFKIPFIETPHPIRINDQFPMSLVFNGGNGIDIDGLGSMDFKFTTEARIVPQSGIYNTQVQKESNLITIARAYEGDTQAALANIMPTLVYKAWSEGLRPNPNYREYLRRALSTPQVHNNAILAGQVSPEELNDSSPSINQMMAGVQRATAVYNKTAWLLGQHIAYYASKEGIFLAPGRTSVDPLPNPTMAKITDNMAEFTQAQLDAVEVSMKTKAKYEAMVQSFAPLLGTIATIINDRRTNQPES